jgi:hypothetical protein
MTSPEYMSGLIDMLWGHIVFNMDKMGRQGRLSRSIPRCGAV